MLKASDSRNNQPNDNSPNYKVKSFYNKAVSNWYQQFGTIHFAPDHINSVLVDSWVKFKLASTVTIKNRLSMTKILTLQHPCDQATNY